MTGPGPTRGGLVARQVVLGLLCLALIASVAVMAWLLAGRRGQAADLQSQRDSAMSQGRSFVLAIGDYNPSMLDAKGQMPAYRARVTALITPKFAESFDRQGIGTAETLVKQAKVARTASVFATGVSAIDSDTATVLVAGQFVDAYPDKQGKLVPQPPVPVRFQLSLVRVGGKWLVDDFGPVGGGQ